MEGVREGLGVWREGLMGGGEVGCEGGSEGGCE